MTDLYEAGDINQTDGGSDADVDMADDEAEFGQRARANPTRARRWRC